MVSIELTHNQIPIIIQANLNEPFQQIMNKYFQKTSIDPKSVCFLSNGKNLSPELTVESLMSGNNKQDKKMQVLVYSLVDENKNNEPIMVKSKDIICPICYEPCRIKFEDYKIKLYDCPNNHETNNIPISEFQNKQNIDLSKIICIQCKEKNKGNTTDNKFYRCLDCKINLCVLCKSFHEQSHNIIDYDNKNFTCNNHNEPLIKYCKKCHVNFCFSCDEEHKKHDTVSLLDLKPDMAEANNKLLELKKEIESFNQEIQILISRLNELSGSLGMFYEINNELVKNYEIKNRNYQLLNNIREINNNDIYNSIKMINSTKNFNDKIVYMMNLYNKINIENINQMTIIYKINKNTETIRLFGDKFVRNNKDNCYVLIEGQKFNLDEFYNLNKKQKAKKALEIKLVETKPISDMYRFFYLCTSLLYLPDIDKWDTKNVTNMRSMFNECTSLQSLPDISKWNTKNVTTFNNMFFDCYELESIPDISKWDVQNVTDASQMFLNCKSLKSLPDISKWMNNKKLIAKDMFFGCDEKIIPKNF